MAGNKIKKREEKKREIERRKNIEREFREEGEGSNTA